MYVLAHIGIATGVLLALAHQHGKDVSRHDIRLLVIGAMLPDLLDKPLNIAGLSAGRRLAHTTLFAVVCLLLCPVEIHELAFGSIMHYTLDALWRAPAVLFWPLRGISLPSTPYDVAYYWERVMESGYVQATEVLGAVILLVVIVRYRLYRPAAVRRLLLTGRIAGSHG
jgi:uncharacterized membrane-anchored protein